MSFLEPFQTVGRNGWDKTLAAHLLNRVGFGGLPEDIAQVAEWGKERAVDYFVDFEAIPETIEPPETPDLPDAGLRATLKDLAPDERRKKLQEFGRANREAIEKLRGWWIRRMLTTKRPLQEKLTLFWHGHFATSANDVKAARHMLNQNEFLRRNCTGNFRDLLLGISRDPAMLRYLDNNTNRKQHPNENYARELMELFSMGIGNYTEDDVQAAARAFTGWTFRGEEFVFLSRQHDYGVKAFLHETGKFDGTDVVDILLKQPCTARFMANKLLRFFVSDKPESGAVDELATLIRQKNYDFKPVLRTLFNSAYFYSPQVYRTQIKSPAQLVIGSVRLLGVKLNERVLAVAMRSLGQDLLYPPNVKGWDGGEAWINTDTLLQRYNIAGYLLGGELPVSVGRGKNKQRQIRLGRLGKAQHELNEYYGPDIATDAPRIVDALIGRLLQTRLDVKARQWLIEQAEVATTSERPALIAHLIMSMPDYQLC